MRHFQSQAVVQRPSRAAFTIIELMMVVMIIALLVALLLPAVNAVIVKAKDAQVVAEMKGLSNGADEFNTVYGTHPPSYIVLSETGAWPQESRNVLQKIFGREFSFAPRELDGRPGRTARIVLTGSECLVFFLGGMPRRTGGQWVLHGFSPNKTDPFAVVPGARNRVQFFKNFDVDRLDDDDGDGFPDYHDILNAPGIGKPYLFLSTGANGVYNATRDAAGSGLRFAYNQGTPSTPWKPDGFQIISPGRDHVYGPGGRYTLENGGAWLVGPRDAERDNMTSFAGSRLAR